MDIIDHQLKPSPLTPKEKQILEFIENYITANSFSPSYQEIKEHFGFASFYSIQRYLKQLNEKNYIRTEGNNKKRSIDIINPSTSLLEAYIDKKSKVQISEELIQLPLLGSVAAGLPLEKQEFDEYIPLAAKTVKNPSQSFALKVEGDSMIEEGILDGDILILESIPSAETGQLIVASIENEATVKRFYKHKKNDINQQVELRPSNANMKSLFFHPSQVEIKAKVVGLFREY